MYYALFALMIFVKVFNVYYFELVLGELAGFQGSTAFNYLKERSTYKCGAIAHTYTALSTLLILGDDLSRVHRQSIVRSKIKLIICLIMKMRVNYHIKIYRFT